MVDTRTKSAGTPTFLCLTQKEKAAYAAFLFLFLVETDFRVAVISISVIELLSLAEKAPSYREPGYRSFSRRAPAGSRSQ